MQAIKLLKNTCVGLDDNECAVHQLTHSFASMTRRKLLLSKTLVIFCNNRRSCMLCLITIFSFILFANYFSQSSQFEQRKKKDFLHFS